MKVKVWGEWQEYYEAAEHDATTEESAALHVAKTCVDAFPEANDGDQARIYVRHASSVDPVDDWSPEGDGDTRVFVVTQRVSVSYDVKAKR